MISLRCAAKGVGLSFISVMPPTMSPLSQRAFSLFVPFEVHHHAVDVVEVFVGVLGEEDLPVVSASEAVSISE